MIIEIIGFTHQGIRTAERIRKVLEREHQVRIWCKKEQMDPQMEVCPVTQPLKEWTGEHFTACDAMIFVGATGIAVRSIAPFLVSKKTDPAVLAVDELGKYVISLVSGHIGGANELCLLLADQIGGQAVVTTATDLNHQFAVDVFARKNGMKIMDMTLAKKVSADLLDGKEIGLISDFPVTGPIPEHLVMGQERDLTIRISCGAKRENTKQYLYLVPQICYLGVGCRRGKEKEKLEVFLTEVLAKADISMDAVAGVRSIDVKADEEGILAFCRAHQKEFMTYSSEALMAAPGDYEASAFVRAKVGTDNVCERSAVLGSGGGTLLVHKTAFDGMTAAVAVKEWRAEF